MEKYPSAITPQILEQNKHISDYEITQDIADTQIEIQQKIKEAEGYRLIVESKPGTLDGKMAYFRQESATLGASERAQFVVSLEKLLEARKSSIAPAPKSAKEKP